MKQPYSAQCRQHGLLFLSKKKHTWYSLLPKAQKSAHLWSSTGELMPGPPSWCGCCPRQHATPLLQHWPADLSVRPVGLVTASCIISGIEKPSPAHHASAAAIDQLIEQCICMHGECVVYLCSKSISPFWHATPACHACCSHGPALVKNTIYISGKRGASS